MTRPRSSLAAGVTLSLTAAATTWAAMLSWRGFSEGSGRSLTLLVLLGGVIGGLGALMRWYRVPGALVVGVQVLVGTCLASLMITGSPVPGGAFAAAIDDAVEAATVYAAPVPDLGAGGVHPLLVIGGLVSMLLVDTLACTWRRVPLAGLPLLTVYSVPVSLLEGQLSWWVFALSAFGFIAMLYLQEREQVILWGRPLDESAAPDRSGTWVRSGALRASAAAIGVVATVVAVIVPLAIPTLSLAVLDLGRGSGGGSEINIDNPMADLKRDLTRGEDVPLVQVTTDDPDPEYLRVTVLNRFTDEEWSPGDRDIPTDQLPEGQMPPLAGVDQSVPRTEYDYSVEVDDDFRSTWLPTQAPISRIRAEGDWRFDERTMDFIAGEDDLDTGGASYDMTAVELDLDPATLARAVAADDELFEEELDLPSEGLPPIVTELATGVTDQYDTRFEKAQALQNWFREDGGFEYSLAESESGSGSDTLTSFLTEGPDGRVGYCEQFAASMAVMARVLDIPARVSVGFLAPDEVPGSDGEWVYSSEDLHAWPELYFPGAGWVLFDPTPSDRVDSVPDYTTENLPDTNPTPSTAPTESESPSTQPSQEPSQSPTTAPEEQDPGAGSDDAGAGFPWGRTLGGLGAALVLVGLAALPRSWRLRRRTRRLEGGPEKAWEELRDSVLDLGRPWPDARSPRETQPFVADHFGSSVPPDGDVQRPAHRAALAPEAVAALGRVVGELEVSRYSRRRRLPDGALRDDVLACIDALRAGATGRARRRAEWLPTSLARSSALRPTRRDPQTADEAGPDPLGGRVEHI